MQGDVEAHRQKVRLQLCATTATSQAGQPFWSSPVQLDALGGAAVVEAPCPMTAAPSHKEAQAGFQLAVTAVQVELFLLHGTCVCVCQQCITDCLALLGVLAVTQWPMDLKYGTEHRETYVLHSPVWQPQGKRM